MYTIQQVGHLQLASLTSDEQRTVTTSPKRSRRPQRAHIPPIRSLTIRDVVHHPSRRTLRHSEGDGPADLDAGEQRKPPDEPHNITRAIDQLESLVQQTTELAAQPPRPAQTTPKKRRPSEDITAKGHTYLAKANASPESLGSSSGQQPCLTFSTPHRQPQRPTVSPSEDQGNRSNAVQACSPAHGESIGTKAAAAAPQIIVTTAIDATAKQVGDGQRELQRQQKQQKRQVPLPQRPPPAPPPQLRHKSAIDPGAGEPGQQRLGLPPGLKPNRRDVSPFEDEEQGLWTLQPPRPGHERHFTQMFGIRHSSSVFRYDRSQTSASHIVNLKRVNHVDLLNKPEAFDVHTSCDHAPVARNWPDTKKRLTATITCINTSCLGLLIGIYSGEVPAIQYKIADFHHFAILGNVFVYCGLAVSTLCLWPLPLLHGRKVYTVAGLATALGLQIPQGIAVLQPRMPDDVTWRTLIILSRALSGLALGLVNINLLPTLHDLFGASLQSSHPYGELVDPYDVRRHGGGMGFWLAAWS